MISTIKNKDTHKLEVKVKRSQRTAMIVARRLVKEGKFKYGKPDMEGNTIFQATEKGAKELMRYM